LREVPLSNEQDVTEEDVKEEDKMENRSPEMQRCIDACSLCADACRQMVLSSLRAR